MICCGRGQFNSNDVIESINTDCRKMKNKQAERRTHEIANAVQEVLVGINKHHGMQTFQSL